MANQADGEKAISELDGQEFAGRQLKVNEAKPREDPVIARNRRRRGNPWAAATLREWIAALARNAERVNLSDQQKAPL